MTRVSTEWNFTGAAKLWTPMTKAVVHVGVPGYQWQAAMLWNGDVVFGPLGFREPVGTFAASALPVEFAELGNNLLHVSAGFGDPPKFYDPQGRGDPAVKRSLEEGRLPIPHAEITDGDLTWDISIFAHLLDRAMRDGMRHKPGDMLVVHAVYKVVNPSAKSRDAKLTLHLGDASRTSFGYKVSVGDALEPAIAHNLREGLGLMEGRVRYAVPVPSRGTVCAVGSVTPANLPGPVQNVITWEVSLAAGASAEFEVVFPYGLIDAKLGRKLVHLDRRALLAEVRKFWHERLEGPGEITTPDAFINDYAAAFPSQALQQIAFRPKARVWMYKTSPNQYQNYWPCNAARPLPGLDMRGLREYSERVLQSFIDTQSDDHGALTKKRDDSFKEEGDVSGEGYERRPGFIGHFPGWTANTLLLSHGYGLWALAAHFRVTRDKNWLNGGTKSPLAAMLEGCDWIAHQRRRTMREVNGRKVPHWGLLPAASAHDWLSGNTIFNDTFCIYGMSEVVRLLREIRHPRTEEVSQELNDYRACLRERYVEARDRAKRLPLADGREIPFVPRDVSELDWATLDWTYCSWGPLRAGAFGALDPHDELIDQTLAFLDAGMPNAGASPRRFMHFTPGTADENWRDLLESKGGRAFLWKHYNDYETMHPVGPDLFLQRDDLPRFFEWFFNTFSVVLHREWRVGVESLDGVPSCAPGDGERWRAIRDMFVYERGGGDGSQQSLWLFQAIPQAWLIPGETFGVKRMGTHFGGEVTLAMRPARDANSVSVEAELALAVLPAEIRMRLRSNDGRRLAAADVNGAPADVLDGDTIRLPQKKKGSYRITGRFVPKT